MTRAVAVAVAVAVIAVALPVAAAVATASRGGPGRSLRGRGNRNATLVAAVVVVAAAFGRRSSSAGIVAGRPTQSTKHCGGEKKSSWIRFQYSKESPILAPAPTVAPVSDNQPMPSYFVRSDGLLVDSFGLLCSAWQVSQVVHKAETVLLLMAVPATIRKGYVLVALPLCPSQAPDSKGWYPPVGSNQNQGRCAAPCVVSIRNQDSGRCE